MCNKCGHKYCSFYSLAMHNVSWHRREIQRPDHLSEEIPFPPWDWPVQKLAKSLLVTQEEVTIRWGITSSSVLSPSS